MFFLALFFVIPMLVFAKLDFVDLDVELGGSGFHRILQYSLIFSHDLGRECEFYLEQYVPASVYVNPDELSDIRRTKRLDAIYPPNIDVELPTEKAQPFLVFLHGTCGIQRYLEIPIHFRYHAPGTTRFVKVDIDHPRIFVRCHARNSLLSLNDEPEFCFEGEVFSEAQNKTESINDSDCGWKLLENIRLSKKALSTNIPVGNKSFYVPVLWITIIVSWVGCVCILFAVNQKMKMLNKKLS